MAFQGHEGVDYDTDEVSINSTVPDELHEDQTFECERILAVREYEDGSAEYLIKWTDYPLHECTWEPHGPVEASTILEQWTEFRDSCTDEEFERYCQENNVQVEAAQARVAEAKARRHDKRMKKRKKLQERRPSAGLGHSVLRKRKETLAESGSEADKEDQGSKSQPNRRRAELIEQPSLSESEEVSSDSLMEELASQGPEQLPVGRSSLERNNSGSRKSSGDKIGTMLQQPLNKDKIGASGTRRSSVQDRPKRNSTSRPSLSKAAVQSAPTQRKGSAAKQKPTADPRNMIPRSTNRGIRMINERTVAKKTGLPNGTGQYNKASLRWRAEKRGRNEQAPDPAMLEFVNGPSGKHSTRQSTSRNPPIEATHDVSEIGRLHDATQQQGGRSEDQRAEDDSVDADWEKNKVPLTCFEWKNGSCQYSAEVCRFLHRNTPYISPLDGTVPGKYRTPPTTCAFWFEHPNGCNKSDEDCYFAHWNTGLLAVAGGQAEKIDLNAEPASSRRACIKRRSIIEDPAANQPEASVDCRQPHRLNKSQLTCAFWFNNLNGCKKSADQCDFAHKNTGYLASIGGQSERIDPNAEPAFLHSHDRGQGASADTQHEMSSFTCHQSFPNGIVPPPPPPLSLSPSAAFHAKGGRESHQRILPPAAITCWFWKQGKCRNSERDCKYRHIDTGTVADAPPGFVFWNHYSPNQAYPFKAAAGTLESQAESFPSQAVNDKESEVEVNRPIARPSASLLHLRNAITDAFGLNFDEMFTWIDNNRVDLRVCLMFNPTKRPVETELIYRWLLMHSVEVFPYWAPGAWECFKRTVCETEDGGCILVHPDFHQYAHLSHINRVLARKVKVFEIGYQPDLLRQDSEWACHESFPQGGVIYITDSVFEQKPKEAARLIRSFLEKVEVARSFAKAHDLLAWRLATRPCLLKYLEQKYQDYEPAAEAGNADATARCKSYFELYDTLKWEHEMISPLQPKKYEYKDHDYYPIMSLTEDELIDDDYMSIVERDQEQANNIMVKFYAEWVIENRRDYRHFFVVHTESFHRTEFYDKWQHCEEVMQPEKCTNYIEQSVKNSKIDFLYWRFANAQ